MIALLAFAMVAFLIVVSIACLPKQNGREDR